MKTKDLNLKGFREPLHYALSEYEKLHDRNIMFEEFPDFVLTPEKSNSARTIIPVTSANTIVGDLYAIVFMPGDGTGDDKTFKATDLSVPERLQYAEKPQRVFPRAKKDVVCEGFFPLFSINRHGDTRMFAASLEELTASGNPLSIKKLWDLGQDIESYTSSITSKFGIHPRVQMTTGYDRKNKRFGDPHAIYNASDMIQVAGFLAISEDHIHPLKFKKKWNLPFD